jgi:hypothetical protein
MEDLHTQKSERRQRLQELLGVLKRGIEIDHFQISSLASTAVVRQVFWLNQKSMRLCIDDNRATVDDIENQTAPPGVYIRDVAEIREGFDAYQFRENKCPPNDAGRCLSIVGSERTVAVQFNSQFLRDWFYERLCLLHADVLSGDDYATVSDESNRRTRFSSTNTAYNSYAFRHSITSKSSNPSLLLANNSNRTFNNDSPNFDNHGSLASTHSSNSPNSPSKSRIISQNNLKAAAAILSSDVPASSLATSKSSSSFDYDEADREIAYYRFFSKLKQGISIYHHTEVGGRLRALLVYDEPSKSLILKPQRLSLWDYVSRLWKTSSPMIMSISDISELRLGIHTIGFVRSELDDDEATSCLSLISTQSVFDIQLDDKLLRDDFHDSLVDFIVRYREKHHLRFKTDPDTLL